MPAPLLRVGRRAPLLIRASLGVRALPLLLAAEIVVTFVVRGLSWRYDLYRAVDWSSGAAVISSPLLAGIVAGEVALRERRLGEIVQAKQARHRAALATFSGSTLAAWAAHLIVVASALLVVYTSDIHGSPPVLGVLASLGFLAAGAGVGAALGGLTRSMSMIVVAPVVVFGGQLAVTVMGKHDTIEFGGATSSMYGLRPSVGGQTGMLVGWLMVGIGLAVLPASITRPAKPFRTVSEVVSIAAGIGVVLALGSRFSEATPSYVCAGGSPSICVLSEHRAYLATGRQSGAIVAAILREMKATVPLELAEAPGYRPGAGPIPRATTKPTPDLVAQAVILNVAGRCEQLSPDADAAVQTVFAYANVRSQQLLAGTAASEPAPSSVQEAVRVAVRC